jgi:hypothetical protein
MPWRVVMVGDDLATVVESTLIDDLSRPSSLSDTGWIRPGSVSWSWWSDHESPQHLDRLTEYVDLAAELGWEYTLVDANWNVHADSEMKDLVAYAADRGVGVFLWYNSGGPHNRVPEQPRDRMFDPRVREEEMAKLEDWGVAGIKVDFFHSDKQDTIRLYLDILADAARHHLMVGFHGSTVPRGWTRTWPNLMTMEGVRGGEQYGFDRAYPEVAPWHNTVLALTRNVVGPMDYTPVTFSNARFPHLTTNAHELALAVVFQSSLLHLADAAASYRAASPEVKELLSSVPASWDETRLLDGFPGDFVILARRRDQRWFVAGINGLDRPHEVRLHLDFLGEGTWSSLTVADGGQPHELVASRATVQGKPVLEVTMAPRGGFMQVLSPP